MSAEADEAAAHAADGDPRAAHAAAAAALRRLGNALVGRSIDDELLERIRRGATELAELAEAAPRQSRLPNSARSFYEPPTRDSPPEHRNLFRESIVSGDLNAMGIGAQLWREDEVSVMEVELGPAFEGAPGRSHGGVVAAMLDETFGIVLAIHGEAAYTGRLEVTYRAATPVGRPIRCRGWLVERRGRKLLMRGEVRDGELLCAEAEATFITVDPQRFVESA
jgi:acyl-coenzyme A thioesterase PaaI-like protein